MQATPTTREEHVADRTGPTPAGTRSPSARWKLVGVLAAVAALAFPLPLMLRSSVAKAEGPQLRSLDIEKAKGGHNHFVVRFGAEASPAATGTEQSAAIEVDYALVAYTTTAPGETGSTAWQDYPVIVPPGGPRTLSPDQLAKVPAGWALDTFPDGSVRAVPPSGVAGSTVPTTVAPTTAPATTAPTTTAPPGAARATPPHNGPASHAPGTPLSGDRDVLSIEDLHNGTYAVVTDLSRDELEAREGVASVEEDQWLTPAGYDDPYFGEQWGLVNTGQTAGNIAGIPDADIDAEEALLRSNGTGVTVAVIDTGGELDQPDLQGAWWTNTREIAGNGVDDDANGYVDDVNGWDFFNNDRTVDDPGWDHNHATHIAGIIAAQPNNAKGVVGVAPGAKVMPLKVGSNSGMKLSSIAAAIRYAAANGAKIINASFGTQPGAQFSSPEMESAIQEARAAGVLFVTAAGNSAMDIDSAPAYPASYPYDNVVTVGASTPADGIAVFSNWGRGSVDIFAPGWYITSTLMDGRYGPLSGTSMATPMVVGAAASVWAQHPDWKYAQVARHLYDSVDRQAAFVDRSVTGGRLNLGRASGSADVPVRLDFVGFDQFKPDTPTAATIVARIGDPSLLADNRAYTLKGTLMAEVGGELYGLLSVPLDFSTGETSSATLTDDQGGFSFAPSGGFSAIDFPEIAGTGLEVDLEARLPGGRYVLVAYLDESGAVAGQASAVRFDSAEHPAPPVVTPIGGGTGGSGQNGAGNSGGGSGGSGSTSGGGSNGTFQPAPGGGQNGNIVMNPGDPVYVPPGPGGGPGDTSAGGGGSTGTDGAGNQSGSGGSGGYTLPPETGAGSVVTTAPPGGGGGTSGDGNGSGGSGGGSSQPSTSEGPPVSFPPTDNYGITYMSHSWGPITGGTMISILGHNLPPRPAVLFGGTYARVVDSTSKAITLMTPPHVAGTVDVVVVGPSGRYDVLTDAFTYIDPSNPSTGGSGGSQTGGNAGSGGASGGGGGTSTPPGTDGGGGATTPPGDGSQTGGGTGGGGTQTGGGGTTTPPDPSVDLPNGLRGRRFGPGHPYSGLLGLFGSSVCQAHTCEGLRFG